MKKIRHGNVVGLVDCTSNHDHIFLIMQYCSQGDLSIYIKNRSKQRKQTSQPSPLPPNSSRSATPSKSHPTQNLLPASNQFYPSSPPHDRFPHPPDGGLNEWIIRSFLGQLADALRFLRSHSIIHRDIKPQNLLLHPSSPTPSSLTTPSQSSNPDPDSSASPDRPRYVPEGIPILRVADFGFARVLAPNAGLAETLCGSPLYMAPEILRYEKYDAKADLWSVGAVLFEMAVGKPPFRAQNHVELLRKIEKNEDKILFPDDKVVAEDLQRLIRCLLKRKPAERISFDEFFLIADEVSRVGPLIPPTPYQPSSTLPHSSIPLQPQLTTLHSTCVQVHQTLSPRPPSTSTLPIPTPNKAKPTRPLSLSPFEGEPGAFILDRNIGQRSRAVLQPYSGPSQSSLPATIAHRTSQNGQVSLPIVSPSRVHPGHQAPSPSLLPIPLPGNQRHSSWVPSFPAKYVVPGPRSSNSNTGPSNATGTEIKSKDYALMRSPSLMSSEEPQTSSSNLGVVLHNSKNEDDDDRDLGTEYVVVEKGSVEINAMVDGLSSSPPKPLSLGRRMSRGLMAAKPALAALSSSPHRTNILSASPPPSSLVTAQVGAPNLPPPSLVSSFPPRAQSGAPSPIPTGTHPMNITNFGRSSPSSQGHYGTYPSSPQSFDSSAGGGGTGGVAGGIGSLPIFGKYFPQSQRSHNSYSPISGGPGSAHSSGGPGSQAHKLPLSFPSSAICRVILASGPNQNSVTIPSRNSGFGSPSSLHQQNVHRSPTVARNQHLDAVEVQLLNELEEFACKALVIIQFGDEKLNKILPPPPSAISTHMDHSADGMNTINTTPSSAPTTTIGAFITPSTSQYSNSPLASSQTVDLSMNLIRNYPHQDMTKRNSELTMTGSTTVANPSVTNYSQSNNKAILASEALVLYMKALAFLNKAIRHGVAVVNWKKQSYDGVGATSGGAGSGCSYETGCAIEWLRHKFNEVCDKTEFVKTRVNSRSLLAGHVWADKLIYDRALEKSRSAAVNEYVGDDLAECEIEYEVSLWMLYGLLDQSIIDTNEIFQAPPSHSKLPSSSSSSAGGRSAQESRARRRRRRVGGESQEGHSDEEHDDEFDSEDQFSDHLQDPSRILQDRSSSSIIQSGCPKIIDSILARLDILRTKIKGSQASHSSLR